MRRMTQSELAERCGVDRSYISKLENNTASPRLDFIFQLSDILNICPNEILRIECKDCHRFEYCTRHEHLETDREYLDEHLQFYI